MLRSRARNLQQMGLRHVLEHYLRGLRVGTAALRRLPDLDGDMRDMQFESAWRVAEWDPSLVVVSGSCLRGMRWRSSIREGIVREPFRA